jgi:hypothetical protein
MGILDFSFKFSQFIPNKNELEWHIKSSESSAEHISLDCQRLILMSRPHCLGPKVMGQAMLLKASGPQPPEDPELILLHLN